LSFPPLSCSIPGKLIWHIDFSFIKHNLILRLGGKFHTFSYFPIDQDNLSILNSENLISQG
jgi:hypothetical protein